MNIDALKAVRENFKMGYALSFAEAMLIQQAIDAVLQSGNSGQVPAGYVLVPVEPTPEMLTASYVFAHIDNTADSWKAMLAAAPTAPDGWIPVSDRMPAYLKTVLTSNGFDIGHGWWDGEKWFEDDPVPEEITHWQPLPDAPKVKS